MRILVTGAGRAIGAAIANTLAGAGHHVVATARDPSTLADLDVSLRLPLDVNDDASIAEALASAGELDAVVNNAALAAKGPLESFPIDQMRQILDTNTIGPVRLLQPLLPSWRARGSGVIVNISSIQGKVGTPLEGAYAASKFALEAISEALHYELSHFGIRVVVIEPGYTAPGMKRTGDHVGDPVYRDLWAQWEGTDDAINGPTGRPGPEGVAEAVRRAIEDPETPLRVAVGADSVTVLSARASLDDAAFEHAMRAVLGITW